MGLFISIVILTGFSSPSVAQQIVSGTDPSAQTFRISARESLPLPPGTWRLSWQSGFDYCPPGRQCGSDTSGRVYALENIDPKARIYALLVRRNYGSVDRWPTHPCFKESNEFRDFHGTTESSRDSRCSRGWSGGIAQRSLDGHWWWSRVSEGTRLIAANPRLSNLRAYDQRTFEFTFAAPGRNRFNVEVFVDISDGSSYLSTQPVLAWKDRFARSAFDGLFSNKPPANFEMLSLRSDNDINPPAIQMAAAPPSEPGPPAQSSIRGQQGIQSQAVESEQNNIKLKLELERLAQEQQQRELALERQKLELAQKEQARLALELKELRNQLTSAQKDTAPTPPAMVSASRRLALVIGNDAYSNVPKLQNARSDARAMAQGLQGLGFKVTLQMDLSERGMKDALRAFRTDIQGGDEVVVFFAGHGVQLGAANYLLPVDIRGDSEEQVRDEAIPLQRILDDLSERKARFSLAIIDACRDNPFRTSGRSIGGRGLAAATAASGQMVIFSAGAGQQALDRLGDADKDPNGLFTRVFLREMKKPGQAIDRIIRTVRSEVVAMAKTVGHEQVPALYDQTLGDFFFVR